MFEDAHTLRLLNGNRTVTAEKILIATGNRPTREWAPQIPGGELVHHLQRGLPSGQAAQAHPDRRRRLYRAWSSPHIFHGLGVEVTLVYRGEQDPARLRRRHARRAAPRSMLQARHRRSVCESPRSSSAARVACTPTVTLQGAAQVEADQIMHAIGRAPNTKGSGPREGRRRAGRQGRGRGRRVFAHLGRSTSTPSATSPTA